MKRQKSIRSKLRGSSEKQIKLIEEDMQLERDIDYLTAKIQEMRTNYKLKYLR